MMRVSVLDNPAHWRKRAAEMRALSKTMDDVETRVTMLRLADDYEKLADQAATRARATPLSK
jgi:hypothetical protein